MSGINSQGSKLLFKVPTDNDYTELSCVTSIDGLYSGTTNQIETTCLSSTAKEFISGLADSGSLTFTYNWANNAAYTALRSAANTAALMDWKVEAAPDDTTNGDVDLTFQGSIESMPFPALGVDAVMSATCTVKISGAITEA